MSKVVPIFKYRPGLQPVAARVDRLAQSQKHFDTANLLLEAADEYDLPEAERDQELLAKAERIMEDARKERMQKRAARMSVRAVAA
jgi:hypothetical protein